MELLKTFCKKQKPKRRTSKLKKYEREIRELYRKGYKVEQIQDFLKKNKIKVEIWGIYKFLKLNKTLSTEKFSFKNPAASKNLKQKKMDGVKIEEDKALNAFLIDCNQTAETLKKYKEQENDLHSSQQ